MGRAAIFKEIALVLVQIKKVKVTKIVTGVEKLAIFRETARIIQLLTAAAAAVIPSIPAHAINAVGRAIYRGIVRTVKAAEEETHVVAEATGAVIDVGRQAI